MEYESIQNQDLTDTDKQAKTCRLDTNETNLTSENVSLVYAEESQSLLKGYDKNIQLENPNQDTDTPQFVHEDIFQKGQHYVFNVSHENHNTGRTQELLGLGDDDIFCESRDTCNLAILGTSSEVESQSILKNLHNSQKKIIDHETRSTRYEKADEDSDDTQITNIKFNDEYVADIELDSGLDTSPNEDKQCNTVDSDTILDIDSKKTCLNTHAANTKTQNLQPKWNSNTNSKLSTNTSESGNLNANSSIQVVDSRVSDTASQHIESEFRNNTILNPNELSEKINMHYDNSNDYFVKSKSYVQVETDMTQNMHAQNETILEMLSQAIIDINEDMDRDNVDSSENRLEIECSNVPFKVIIELNKVKQTLTTMSGYNMKTQLSGYKSDSQMSFTQNLTTGLRDSAVNQSANCLLAYMSSCSVNCLRQPMTADIADALSNFVDMMYERDIILPFMDEILSSIDHILERILSGKGCGKDELLCKEENISRLSLLTESVEMTNYAIGKIMPLVESFHPRLRAQTPREVDSIEDIENICYAFNVLEFLLERYMKNCKSADNIDDNKEDEPERELHNSISDIWRKRWDPNFKLASTKPASRRERSDVVGQGTQLLNKYIVSCMNNYSLVSYAALECYNALHT